MAAHSVHPALVDECSSNCNRVAYIDLASTSAQRNNILKKLTTEMQREGWFPRAPTTSSSLFYGRWDDGGTECEDSIKRAIAATKATVPRTLPPTTYSNAEFDYAIFRPLSQSKDDLDYAKLFERMFQE